MKIKSVITALICCLMVFITLFRVATPALAEEPKLYIKEIVTSTGSTAAEAKKWLTDNGYTVLDNNLNAGTDENPVYLGYKTTNKKSEAITDISMMEMEGGYELMDYAAFASQNQSNITQMTANLKAACAEMKSNLDAGSKAAQTALDYLNIFTVPEANMLLGDYLLDEKRTDKDYRMILLVCNSLVINIIYTELSLGCSDYGKESWAKRLSELGPDETLRGADYDEYWQHQFELYYDDAYDIYQVLVAFLKKYNAAVARKEANGGDIVTADVTDDEASEAIESFIKTGDTADDSADDALVLSVVEYLNQFTYTSDMPIQESDYASITVKPEYVGRVKFDGENAYFINKGVGGYGNEPTYEQMPFETFLSTYADYSVVTNSRRFTTATKLGDALLEIAGGAEDDEDNISLLYPLVNVLTTAQKSLFCIDGLMTFTSINLVDDSALAELDNDLDGYKTDLLQALDDDVASVWMGTNRDIYDSKIALTSEARRDAAASNDYEEITKVTDFDLKIKVSLCYIGAAAAISTGATLIYLGVGVMVIKAAVAFTACSTASTIISAVAFGCIGLIGVAISVLIIAALIICAIVYAVDYLIDLYKYYNPEYTDIPSVMIDTVGGEYIIYHAVTDRGYRNSDINIWEGKKWDALYYTTDTNAGSPLTLDDSGKCFSVVYGSTKVPAGMTSVKRFGTEVAVNLNTYTYDDDVNGIYLYYLSEQADKASDEEGIYLESMIMLTHEQSSVVRDLIKIKGYDLLDFNLTSDTDYATYIGYKTTTNPNNAITDIRVSYAGSDAKYYFGDVSDTYGCAGNTALTTEGEATELMTSLYYTKSKKRGTPIYANLLATKSKNTPIGYEPVNLFCGGGAYDFNTYAEESPSDWSDHAYIYFEPETYYDAGNSTEYLGGIVFVSGSTDMDYGKLEDYAAELGLAICKNDLTRGFFNDEDRTWLCYSTTYNPYRAIYDIGVYTCEYKSSGLIENIVLDGVGYSACQTYTQGDRSYYGNIFWGGNYRILRPSHAYISNNEDYGGDDEYGDTLVCNRGMFVCGPESGKTPIKISDLKFSKTAEIADGYIAVRDMTDKFATKALNIALYDGDNKNSLYVTYPGTSPVKLKYISKITVITSHAEDFAYDKTMYALMSSGGDEIIKINLAELSEDSWRNTSFAAGFDEDSDLDDYEDSVAYIRVTRTKSKNEGIGTIIMVQSDKKPADNIKNRYDETDNVGDFTLAGDGISYCEGKKYYLYYSKMGNKISELTIDKNAVVSSKVTVLDKNKNLITNIGYYFHTYSDTSLPYYSVLSIASGDNDMAAIKTLLSRGCTEVIRIGNANKHTYLGYVRTSSTLKAIRNIIIANTAAETITVGEYTYTKCGSANGVSFYQTTDGVKTKAITNFAYGPITPDANAYTAGTVFEYVQDIDGNKANIAKSIGASGEYYVYISHKDNTAFSSKAYFASVVAHSPSLVCIFSFVGVLILVAAVLLVIKKKKSKGGTQ